MEGPLVYTPVVVTRKRKGPPNCFLLYKADFKKICPEICELVRTPPQRMKIMAAIWAALPRVRKLFNDRYAEIILSLIVCTLPTGLVKILRPSQSVQWAGTFVCGGATTPLRTVGTHHLPAEVTGP